MRDLKRIHLKKYNVFQERGTRRQTETLYEVRTLHNLVNESDQKRKRFLRSIT